MAPRRPWVWGGTAAALMAVGVMTAVPLWAETQPAENPTTALPSIPFVEPGAMPSGATPLLPVSLDENGFEWLAQQLSKPPAKPVRKPSPRITRVVPAPSRATVSQPPEAAPVPRVPAAGPSIILNPLPPPSPSPEPARSVLTPWDLVPHLEPPVVSPPPPAAPAVTQATLTLKNVWDGLPTWFLGAISLCLGGIGICGLAGSILLIRWAMFPPGARDEDDGLIVRKARRRVLPRIPLREPVIPSPFQTSLAHKAFATPPAPPPASDLAPQAEPETTAADFSAADPPPAVAVQELSPEALRRVSGADYLLHPARNMQEAVQKAVLIPFPTQRVRS